MGNREDATVRIGSLRVAKHRCSIDGPMAVFVAIPSPGPFEKRARLHREFGSRVGRKGGSADGDVH